MTTLLDPAPGIDEFPRPRPDDARAVLIFDGACKFCRANMRRILRRDRGRRVAFLSLHDPVVYERYPDLRFDELMRSMVLVDRQGGRHAGAAALRVLTRLVPRLWWMAPLLHIPGSLPVWQWLYRRIADRRYRWGALNQCDDGSCRLPDR
jgi:predicted DCC family thiol-disulfide oxidoreductase YuxK